MNKRNNKRVVIVTGSSSGIGLDTVKLFQKNGDMVYALSRTNAEKLENFCECDVGDETKVKTIISEIGNRHGRIDVIINNAGYGHSGITELVDTADAKRMFDVNVLGVHYCTKYALPYMDKGAKIINISSAAAIFPVPFRAFYAASKAAVLALTYAQRGECWPLGIDIAAVSPGNTKTSFTKNREKNFETNERYGDRMQRATEKIDKGDDKRMPSVKVAKKIFHLSRKRRMPPQTIVGNMKVVFFMSRFLPISWMRRIVDKTTG